MYAKLTNWNRGQKARTESCARTLCN